MPVLQDLLSWADNKRRVMGRNLSDLVSDPSGTIPRLAETAGETLTQHFQDPMNFVGGGIGNIAGKFPLPHGTAPLREGHVRLYHQTDGDNLREIEKNGLLLEKAKGIEGPRAIYAGETPFYGAVDSRPTLEFQVPKDKWDAPFVLRDVLPDDMIGAHYPWQRHARYLEEPGNEKAFQNALSGAYDNLDGDTGKAVAYIKEKYGEKRPMSDLMTPRTD